MKVKLTYIIIASLLLTPGLSIYGINRYNDYQELVPYFIILITAVITIAHTCINRLPINIKINKKDVLTTSFVSLVFFRFLCSDIFSLKSSLFLLIFCSCILYINLEYLDRDKFNIEKIICNVFPYIGIVLCVHALLQYLGIASSNNQYFVIVGTFQNPSIFTNFLCLIAPITLNNLFCNKLASGKYHYLINFLSFTLLTIIIILANERSSWISFASANLLVLLFNIENKKRALNTLNNPIVITSLLLVLLITSSFLYYMRPASVLGRVLVYKNTLDIIKHNWIFGIGPNKFPAVYNLYQADYLRIHSHDYKSHLVADNTTVAFNDYLQLFAELGIFGFVLCLIIFKNTFLFIKKNIKNYLPSRQLGLIASLFAIAVAASVSYPFRNNIIILYSLIILNAIKFDTGPAITLKLSLLKSTIIKLCCSFPIAYILFELILTTNAQIRWNTIAVSGYNRQKKLHDYSKLKYLLAENPYFLYNYGVELALNENYEESVRVLESAKRYIVNTDVLIYLGDGYLGSKKYNKAFEMYSTAVYMVPKKLLPKYALMQYYQELNDTRMSYHIAKQIVAQKKVIPSSEASIIIHQANQVIKGCK